MKKYIDCNIFHPPPTKNVMPLRKTLNGSSQLPLTGGCGMKRHYRDISLIYKQARKDSET